jgi:hypothetical protein
MKAANELAREARDDNFFNEEFIKANLKDPSLADAYLKRTLFMRKRLAIVLGSVLIVALGSTVFSFVSQARSLKSLRELENQKVILSQRHQDLGKQRALATEAQLFAEEANKMALEQLKECQQKNLKSRQ